MMNVLFVITNINGFHEIPYSFGLSSIASSVQEKGYNVKIISIRTENEYGKLISEVVSFDPKVVGFTSVSSQFGSVKKAAKLVKEKRKDMLIVCGGIHPTLYSDALLESDSIDGFFIGESEMAFTDFLQKIKENKEYRDSNNFAYKKDGHVVRNKLNPIIDNIEILPPPLKDDLFGEYIENNGYAPFFFSRGCPFFCTYCSNKALAGIYNMTVNRPRYRSVDSCIVEIKETLKNHRFKTLFICDDTFGINKKWRKDFCERYKNEVGLKFICLLRANVVDEDFIKLLKDSGCYRIQFGVESGNEYVRNTIMKRNLSTDVIVNAFNLCRQYGIETVALNIIGVPGETEEMICDTVKLNKLLKPTDSGVNIYYPYKGTPLGDYCFAEGLVDEDMYNNFSNERRDSVLKSSPRFKGRLRYFYKNWTVLIYPYEFKRRMISVLQSSPPVYRFLRTIKRTVCGVPHQR